jgi:ACT domain-containing protein
MDNKVKSAVEATEIARSFIKKYRSYTRPLKAVQEDDTWLVEIDVGPIFTVIAKIKVDAKSGDILEYTIPS